jgi:hypothetical protein
MTTQTKMTRKELQTILRDFKDIGQTVIDLRASTDKLKKEYDRLNEPKTVKIVTGKLSNGTYGCWVNGKYDYLTERQITLFGAKDQIEAQNQMSDIIKSKLKDIINNPEMMSKLNEEVESNDNILELRPKKTMSWQAWLEFALENFNESRLIAECPKLIDKAYQLAK